MPDDAQQIVPAAPKKRGNPNFGKPGVVNNPTGKGRVVAGGPGINPKGHAKSLANVKMAKYRQALATKITAKFDARHVVEVMEAWLEHVRDRHDPVKGQGWQKSSELFMDRLLGKARVEGESDDERSGVSRDELVVNIYKSFGLHVHQAPAQDRHAAGQAGSEAQETQEAFEGEATLRPALPGPTGEGPATSGGPVASALPIPEGVDH